jgi:hypothetical protein
MNGSNWNWWRAQDLWSEREFAVLCCGLDPAGSFTQDETISINEASEQIRRAVHASIVPYVSRDDADTAARMYGNARHFRPRDVAAWAAKRFAAFPQELHGLSAIPESEQAKALRTTERESLLQLIAALAEIGGVDLRDEGGHYAAAKRIFPELERRKVGIGVQSVAMKLKDGRDLIRPCGPTRIT